MPGLNKLQTAQKFHNLTNPAHSSFDPAETLSFTMAGLNFSPISNFMNVEQGLSSLSISLTESGVQVSLAFSSKQYPNVAEQMRLQRVGPKMNANAYLRTW